MRYGLRAWMVLAGLAAAACARTTPPDAAREVDVPVRAPIEDVVTRRAPELMRIPGVTIVYVGAESGAPCIRVGFAALPSPERDRVPAELEGWPVHVDETGEIRPLGDGS